MKSTISETPVHLPENEAIDTATLDLLAEWDRQDATDDPEEIRVAEQELAEFKKRMNENRSPGERLLFP